MQPGTGHRAARDRALRASPRDGCDDALRDLAIGFGFGLISRSLGGGIALSLIFVLAFDGFVSFIPGAADYTYGQLSQDLTNGLGDAGETVNSLAVAITGTLAWCALIVLPGWLRFLRGDLK